MGGGAFKIGKCVATKGLTSAFFGCVASKVLSGAIFVSVAGKGLTGFLGVGGGVVRCKKTYRKRRAGHEHSLAKIQKIVKNYYCRNSSGSNAMLTSRKIKRLGKNSPTFHEPNPKR